MNSERVILNNLWDFRENIVTIPKNQLCDIVVSHCKKDHRDYIDIRVYRGGTPTIYGVSFGYKAFKKILAAMNIINERIKE